MTTSAAIIHGIDARHDGRACIACGRADRPMVPLPDLGPTGSQVFRCLSCQPPANVPVTNFGAGAPQSKTP